MAKSSRIPGAICGARYGANGSDFHQRKCPNCQGGMPGLDILEWVMSQP